MNGGYSILLIPLGVFLLCGICAIVLYFFSRDFWRRFLDGSRGARFLFMAVSVIVLPLILGGWSDIVDASELLQGNVEWKHVAPLSMLAILLVGYLYLHGCWFDREEYSLVARTSELSRIGEIDCQRNYLVSLLENLRGCIGKHAERLRAALRLQQPDDNSLSRRLPSSLLQENRRLLCEAVRQTYKTLESIPAGYDVKLLLLEAFEGALQHVESYDGTDWDCFLKICETHKSQYFSLSSPNSSAAVAAVVSKTIQIVESCDVCHKDENHPFWYFQDCIPMQRAELGSMLVIPFDLDSTRRFALCLTCQQPLAFLKKHKWKAETIQENLRARLSLLYSQAEVFETLRAENLDTETTAQDAECESSSLRHQVSELERQNELLLTRIKNSEEIRQQLSSELEKRKEAAVESKGRTTTRKNPKPDEVETRHE